MYKISALLISCLFVLQAHAQKSSIDELVSKGNDLYDKGQVVEALVLYQQAQAIDTNAERPNYELANLYINSQKYDKALYYIEKVIRKNGQYVDQAYTLKGTAYDMMGKFDLAVQAYTDGIKRFPDDYMLNFNLGLAYYNAKDDADAEIYAIKAIRSNSEHPSSHLLLAQCMYDQGKRVQALLPLYYFLWLEPQTKRSKGALALLDQLLQKGVKKESENNITISVSTVDGDEGFSAADLAISMSQALKYDDKNKGKDQFQLFTEGTNNFFSIMGELKDKAKNKNIWWDVYVPFFYGMVQAGHNETYCYYISASKNDDSMTTWLKNNKNKTHDMIKWCVDHSNTK